MTSPEIHFDWASALTLVERTAAIRARRGLLQISLDLDSRRSFTQPFCAASPRCDTAVADWLNEVVAPALPARYSGELALRFEAVGESTVPDVRTLVMDVGRTAADRRALAEARRDNKYLWAQIAGRDREFTRSMQGVAGVMTATGKLLGDAPGPVPKRLVEQVVGGLTTGLVAGLTSKMPAVRVQDQRLAGLGCVPWLQRLREEATPVEVGILDLSVHFLTSEKPREALQVLERGAADNPDSALLAAARCRVAEDPRWREYAIQPRVGAPPGRAGAAAPAPPGTLPFRAPTTRQGPFPAPRTKPIVTGLLRTVSGKANRDGVAATLLKLPDRVECESSALQSLEVVNDLLAAVGMAEGRDRDAMQQAVDTLCHELRQAGATLLWPKLGAAFDPARHQAIDFYEGGDGAQVVATINAVGMIWDGRVSAPAMVTVTTGDAAS